MSSMLRVAGLVAAVTLTFAGATGAHAEMNVSSANAVPVSPAVHATAATPMTLLEMQPRSAVAQPAATSAAPSATNVIANLAVRTRPDRVEPAAILASASLVRAPGGPVLVNGQPVPFVRPALPNGRTLEDLVTEHGAIDTPDEQFECLARTVYFESRGEPIEGQLAVAEVVLNRTRSGLYSGTICDVVRQPAQFSFVRGGQIPDVPRDSAAWRRSVGVARVAMQNLAAVTGPDSLFFHATYVNPTWGRVRPRIARIGNHIFYR